MPFLKDARERCRITIESLTDETAARWCSFLELLIYNLRHVHGHASQLNMLLGQNGIQTPDYVIQAREKPLN